MKTPKAQGLSIQTVIVLVLVLMVLTVVAMFFLGVFEKGGGAVGETTSTVTGKLNKDSISEDIDIFDEMWCDGVVDKETGDCDEYDD
tara:strand:- start:149 stop:409 length:261 start_codon:yes stop_codon:yes gene_type:complete